MATKSGSLKVNDLSSRQKVAVLLIFLGHEDSARVFKFFSEEEIEMMTLEIARLQTISSDVKAHVVKEFYEMMIAQDYIGIGGVNYAKDLLEKSLGADRAMDVISRITSSLQMKPFDAARNTEASQLFNFIQGEHPQTIALILSYLQPEKAAFILAQLPTEQQADIAKRVAKMDRTSPEIVREVERVLEKKLAAVISHEFASVGGIDALASILTSVDRGTEKTIIETLEVQDPELADEIKKRMFVFEDMILLDDRSIQRVLREIDQKDLATALKSVGDEVKEKFFKNLSKRAAAILKEEMDYMGPVRLKEVEESQQKIVNTTRQLEEAGEIIISRGGDDELVE